MMHYLIIHAFKITEFTLLCSSKHLCPLWAYLLHINLWAACGSQGPLPWSICGWSRFLFVTILSKRTSSRVITTWWCFTPHYLLAALYLQFLTCSLFPFIYSHEWTTRSNSVCTPSKLINGSAFTTALFCEKNCRFMYISKKKLANLENLTIKCFISLIDFIVRLQFVFQMFRNHVPCSVSDFRFFPHYYD